MTRIAHIVNVVDFPQNNELRHAQTITLESMARAKNYAEGIADVELLAASYPEDAKCIPEEFKKTRYLDRSILDFGSLGEARKLPLLKDILDRLFESTSAEYLVYSNIDIGLMPGFYIAIDRYIKSGIDALIINRRRIPSRFLTNHTLEEIYAEAGELHNGFDCFVFKRDRYPDYQLGDVCIGIPHFCNLLAHNLFRHSDNFKLLTDKHLSFHIGMDNVKNWGGRKVTKHNYSIFRRELSVLMKGMKIKNIPGSGLPFLSRHWKWLMNPNFHYPSVFKLDISQLKESRRKPENNLGKSLKVKYYEWLVRKIKLE